MNTETLAAVTPAGLAPVTDAIAESITALGKLRRALQVADIPISEAAALEPEPKLREFASQINARIDAAQGIATHLVRLVRDVNDAVRNAIDNGAGLHYAASLLKVEGADATTVERGRILFAPRETAPPTIPAPSHTPTE